MSIEPLLPRGFAHSAILLDPDDGEQRVLMLAHPSSSLVTMYPPIDPDLTETERLWYTYQLDIAGMEETCHSLCKRTGGIRNVYLLERKSREELHKAGKKPISDAKAAIVQTELACERLFEGMVDLVETHDKFLTCYLAGEGRPKVPAPDGRVLEQLSQRMDTDKETLRDLMAEQMVSNARDVNAEVFDDLLQLRDESTAVSHGTFLPMVAVLLALDIPFFVAPLTAPNAKTATVEEVDFYERFKAVVEVFNRETVRREINASTTEEQLIDVAYDAVNQKSAAQISDGGSHRTPTDFTLPLLDVAFDPEAAISKVSAGEHRLPQDGERDDLDKLDHIRESLFVTYGGVAICGLEDTLFCFLNRDLYHDQIEQSRYGHFWERELVYRNLVEQVMQRTVDRDNITIQNPLDDIKMMLTEAEYWEELVEHTRQVAAGFEEISVNGEAELRRCRKQRREGS